MHDSTAAALRHCKIVRHIVHIETVVHGKYGDGRKERSPVEVEEVEAWPQGLDAAHSLIADRFSRRKPRRRALNYLRGLVNLVERKNGW